jgi:hypothetical protein
VNVRPDSLQWLPTAYPETFALTFARRVSARELLLRLGCPPDSLTLLTRDDAEEQELEDPDTGHVVRAGEHGSWAWAIQMWGTRILAADVLGAVSAGTEAVVLVNSSLPWFAYVADGGEVCSFDAGMPHLRYGSDPDRFLPLMAEAGILSGPDQPGDRPVLAMLRLAELAFSLSLPKDAVESQETAAGLVGE